jgi:hypothetical protein
MRAITLGLLVAACGGGSGGSATFNGTLHGQSFTAKDAISSATTIQTASGPANVAAIAVTNQSGLCGYVSKNQEPRNSTYFLIFLGVLNNGAFSVPTSAADFTVYAGSGAPASNNVAIVVASTTDASCHDISADDATGTTGVVHLTGVSGQAFKGSFDLTVAGSYGSDHVTGTFNASACSGLGTLISTNTSTTCI